MALKRKLDIEQYFFKSRSNEVMVTCKTKHELAWYSGASIYVFGRYCRVAKLMIGQISYNISIIISLLIIILLQKTRQKKVRLNY